MTAQPADRGGGRWGAGRRRRQPSVGRAVGVAPVGYPPTVDEAALRVVLLAALARIRAS
ncbi:hypothetical protein [Salinispora fenicalii]|uniref:hypothetical protein n=1 Tax=Salinispora fenicalii TaxID=1137263 RepID=UPI0004B1A448|nr:hypothetical protein [Salinispora fenicalii]